MASDNPGEIVNRLFALIGLAPEEKEKISAELGEAIFLNFVYRLFELLPESAKSEFSEKLLDDPKELVKFMSTHVPHLQLQNVLQAAVKEVMGKFVNKADLE